MLAAARVVGEVRAGGWARRGWEIAGELDGGFSPSTAGSGLGAQRIDEEGVGQLRPGLRAARAGGMRLCPTHKDA